MKQSRQVEDYLKTIYRLHENDLVRGEDIARDLGVTKPTVSIALKKLESSGLITIHLSRSVELTQEGERIARDITERYDTLFGLLTDLGVDEQTAYQDACRMEHGISEQSVKALNLLRQNLPVTLKGSLSQPFNKEA